MWQFKTIALLPFAITFFDLVENAGIIFLNSTFPVVDETISALTSLGNQCKWVFAVVVVMLVVFNLIYMLKGRHSKQ